MLPTHIQLLKKRCHLDLERCAHFGVIGQLDVWQQCPILYAIRGDELEGIAVAGDGHRGYTEEEKDSLSNCYL